MDLGRFETRKQDHINQSLRSENQALGCSGLESIRLIHEALPEMDDSEVSLETQSLGALARTPFYISGMTAGHAGAPALNQTLAAACEKRGWAMGVGSQRKELERSADEWQELRERFPKVALFGNIGLSQLIHTDIERIEKLVQNLKAQAFCVHLNALQEMIQPEGTPQFKGGFEALRRLTEGLSVPVILKETGCGFSLKTLKRVSSLKLGAVDVSGLGGTHWGRIEGARAESQSAQAEAAETFSTWGVSTVDSVLFAKQALISEIWASGGVRTGLDAAKLIALGAHRVGFAQPALQAALQGQSVLEDWMEKREFEFKVALFCTGSRNPEKLRSEEGVWNRIN